LEGRHDAGDAHGRGDAGVTRPGDAAKTIVVDLGHERRSPASAILLPYGLIQDIGVCGKVVCHGRQEGGGLTVARLGTPAVLRRLAMVSLFLVPMVTAVAFAAPRSFAQDPLVITMVTDTAGLGDQNFNDAVKEGLDRAAADFGVEARVIESLETADYIPNLEQAAEQSDFTIGVGFLLVDAMNDVAGRLTDEQFMLIDGVATTPDGTPLENVASVIFREHEGGFLGGIIAGLMTKTGKVGILGGQDIPPVERYDVGFQAGVRAIAGDAVEVVVTYTDTFSDPALGKEQSLALYNQDCDIVLAIAGATGIGTFEAAKEKGAGFFVIAADKDQSQLGAEFQLFVITKSLAAATYTTAQHAVEGTFAAGVQDVGLNEGGMGIETPGDKVPADVLARVEPYRQAILDGTLKVPATRDELETFEAPVLGTPAA
jgi:basic membrane protein A